MAVAMELASRLESTSDLMDRQWPTGRRPLDLSMQRLQPVVNPVPIAAKYCPEGHPNNPDGQRCVVCSKEIDRTAVVVDLAPRPVARLLLEDGTSIDVTDPLVIGRSPLATPTGLQPTGPWDTVTVPGRQVSRKHFMLDVQGWQLLVQDADSTNGTFLSRSGERGRRRVPIDRAVPVTVGDTIHFGQRQMLVTHAG